MKTTLKSLVVLLVFGVLTSTSAIAQKTYTVGAQGSPKKQSVSKKLQEMKEALALSDEQVSKIQTLNKDARAKAKAANAVETDPKAKRAAGKVRKAALEASIASVFSPSQAKKYEQWQADQKAERKKKREARK
jgi:exopolysaccharide biosynthesis protein